MRNPSLKRPPYSFFVGHRHAETKRKALENEAEASLTKPIDFGTLRDEIDKRFEQAA